MHSISLQTDLRLTAMTTGLTPFCLFTVMLNNPWVGKRVKSIKRLIELAEHGENLRSTGGGYNYYTSGATGSTECRRLYLLRLVCQACSVSKFMQVAVAFFWGLSLCGEISVAWLMLSWHCYAQSQNQKDFSNLAHKPTECSLQTAGSISQFQAAKDNQI